MSGIIPDPIVGYVNVTDGSRIATNAVPQTGLFSNAGTGFTVGGGLNYLALPSTNGLCGGRITPQQINFMESEMVALAAFVNPTGTWTPSVGNNLAASFAVGMPVLDSTGHIPLAQIPVVLQGALSYQGLWNATTNGPPLVTGVGIKGYVYKVSVAGSTLLDGKTQWNVGDMVAFNGTMWDKWDGLASEVVSVSGRTGNVVLTSVDITDIASFALLASPTFTGSPTAPTQTVGDNSTKLATTAFVLANQSVSAGSTVPPPVRQVVLSGPQTAGVSTLFPASSASLSLTTTTINAGAPLIVTAANGFSGTGGSVDAGGQSTTNLTWTATASTTNYLGVTIAAGVLTPFTTTLMPIYQYGGTIAVTSGQYTFDISQLKMFVGNGTTAAQINAVFIGECVAAAANVGITLTLVYAYLGYYDSGYTNTLPGTGVLSKNSNIGVPDSNSWVYVKNLTTDIGFAVNDVVDLGIFNSNATLRGVLSTNRLTTKYYWFGSSFYDQGSGALTGLQSTKWAYRYVTRRSWGDA